MFSNNLQLPLLLYYKTYSDTLQPTICKLRRNRKSLSTYAVFVRKVQFMRTKENAEVEMIAFRRIVVSKRGSCDEMIRFVTQRDILISANCYFPRYRPVLKSGGTSDLTSNFNSPHFLLQIIPFMLISLLNNLSNEYFQLDRTYLYTSHKFLRF